MPECTDCKNKADVFCYDGRWRCGECGRKFMRDQNEHENNNTV